MAQQWFLDLDGVRSGPYQTPEVLGLIAEGEVLPHHRIASSLKDDAWTTVLEWRLEQAKLANPPAERKSYVPQGQATGVPPQKSKPYEISWNDPKGPVQQAEPPPSAMGEVGAVDLNPDAAEDEIEEVLQVLQSTPAPSAPEPPPPVQKETPPPVAPSPPMYTEVKLEPTHTKSVGSEPVAPPAASAAPPEGRTRKRDPMAEMFDILQNTRQKREAKEKSVQQADPKAPAAQAKSGGSWVKTGSVALLIILAGFMLGQLFQQNSTPPAPVAVTEKNLTAPPREPETKTEVVDRSNEKMTIRAKVERPVIPPPKAQQHAVNAGAAPANDKDVQELKDLKKELQELKALKDELKSNPAPSMDEGSDIPMDEDYLNSPNYENGGGAAYAPGYDPSGGKQGGYPSPYAPNGAPIQPPVNY